MSYSGFTPFGDQTILILNSLDDFMQSIARRFYSVYRMGIVFCLSPDDYIMTIVRRFYFVPP